MLAVVYCVLRIAYCVLRIAYCVLHSISCMQKQNWSVSVSACLMGTRIPPSLDFLVIYNKNLTALPGTIADDDEDAQEEAHILFYTCRQRAVTRDRTLRQVGLAKALASFSEQVQDGLEDYEPLLIYSTMLGCSTGRGRLALALALLDVRLCIR